MRRVPVLLSLLAASICGGADGLPGGYRPLHRIEIIGGTFYGPGRMPDSPLPKGVLGAIKFHEQLQGETEFFNNGVAPPNIASEAQIGKVPDGLLSNGQPFNENVDGGVAEIGRGAMRFLTVAAAGGPNAGREIYRLGKDFNWHLRIDMALDPGYREGLVISENLHITTGLKRVPKSVQSSRGLGGGNDQAGSLPSESPFLGRLGDYNADGWLDGRLVGAANVPIGHIFAPGDPVLQVRDFSSDIPIAPLDAAVLMSASVLNYRDVWKGLETAVPNAELPARLHVLQYIPEYVVDIADRLDAAAAALARAADAQGVAGTRTALKELAGQSRSYSEYLTKQGRAQWTNANRLNGSEQATMQRLFADIDRKVRELAKQTTLRLKET